MTTADESTIAVNDTPHIFDIRPILLTILGPICIPLHGYKNLYYNKSKFN